jgi:beta-glucanase (GH16 family)
MASSTVSGDWTEQYAGSQVDLGHLDLVFADEFNAPSVGASNVSPDAADWFAPVRPTFGSAAFVGPDAPVSPFTVAGGALTISMQQVGGRWQSGHMQSVNGDKQGFALEYGYFEMSAKFPAGAGSWPAFWLLPTDPSKPRVEIDIVEAYGDNDYDGHHAALHITPVAGGDLAAKFDKSDYTNVPGSMFDGQYHTYGAQVTPDWIIIYYDHNEITRFPSNDYIGQAFYMCVDLAMYPGEAARAAGRYDMTVDYVRAYADPAISSLQQSGTAGGDTLSGYDHNDTLSGGAGGDSLAGGGGFDAMNGNVGDDTLQGGAGDDWVLGGKDNDGLDGGPGNDLVYGNLGGDWCDGGDGDDIVRGGQGNDRVLGSAGNDWLSGDRGNDTVSGGAGADTFHASADCDLDYVTDFDRAEGDRVVVDAGVRYAVAQSGDDVVITLGAGHTLVLAHTQLAGLTGDWIGYA